MISTHLKFLRSLRLFSALLMACALLPKVSFSQVYYSTLMIPEPFDNWGHSPRETAMGSAYAAVQGDSACLFQNPAGLDGLAELEVALIHESWIAGISRETFLGALPVSHLGVFGLGLDYLNFGSLKGYDDTGTATASYNPFRLAGTLGWGGPIVKGVSAGFSANGFYQDLGVGSSIFSASFSLGALWNPLRYLELGSFYSFLHTDASPELGLLKFGAAWSGPLFEKVPTTFQVDLSLPPDGVYQLQAGVEQIFLSAIAARLGYQLDLRDNQIGGLRGLSGGIGLKVAGMDLDYSYSPDGDLGNSQMFEVSYLFPEGKKKDRPAEAPPVHFTPPAQLSPEDRVQNVEMNFDFSGNPSPTPVPQAGLPDPAQALRDASQKVRDNPQDANGWVVLGSLYWKMEQVEYAVRCFEEALRLEPSDTPLKNWLDQYGRLKANPTPQE